MKVELTLEITGDYSEGLTQAEIEEAISEGFGYYSICIHDFNVVKEPCFSAEFIIQELEKAIPSLNLFEHGYGESIVDEFGNHVIEIVDCLEDGEYINVVKKLYGEE